MKGPIRVGFILDARLLAWTGGYNYLRNLLGALRSQPVSKIEPVLFCGTNVDASRFASLSSLVREPMVVASAFNATRVLPAIIRTLLTGTNARVEDVLRAHGADVVLENAVFYGRRFGIPSLAWIPDFQHRHLPEMFSWGAYIRREIGFRLQLGPKRTMMVSSEAARRDCISFYGVKAETLAVVPFAVDPDVEIELEDPDEIRRRYGLPSKFLFLPNQFWKHKNHQLVCRALAVLKNRAENVCVAVTGRQQDHRHPEIFKDIADQVERDSIAESFRLLGEIPYTHLIALLRASIALVNPSLFEGWSTTVEEAKTWGVPTIVSDLPVHREQLGATGNYFDPRSETELAELLVCASNSWRPGPREDNEAHALIATRRRREAFASRFEAAVGLTLQNAHVD